MSILPSSNRTIPPATPAVPAMAHRASTGELNPTELAFARQVEGEDSVPESLSPKPAVPVYAHSPATTPTPRGMTGAEMVGNLHALFAFGLSEMPPVLSWALADALGILNGNLVARGLLPTGDPTPCPEYSQWVAGGLHEQQEALVRGLCRALFDAHGGMLRYYGVTAPEVGYAQINASPGQALDATLLSEQGMAHAKAIGTTVINHCEGAGPDVWPAFKSSFDASSGNGAQDLYLESYIEFVPSDSLAPRTTPNFCVPLAALRIRDAGGPTPTTEDLLAGVPPTYAERGATRWQRLGCGVFTRTA